MQSARVCSYPGLSLLPLVLWARFQCFAVPCCAVQGVLTVLAGNLITLVPMILNAHPGTKYGLPFPVLARASFGIKVRGVLPTMSTLKPPTLCLFRQQHRKYHACAGIDISLQLEARHSDNACATQAWALAVEWHGVPRWLTMCAACLAHAVRAPTCRPLRAPLWRAPGLAYRPGLAAAASIRCW